MSDLQTYSLSEVAQRLQLNHMAAPERWLTKQIKAGKIPARKIGRSWRMTEADIRDALEAIKNKPADLPPTDLDQQPRGLSRRSLARRVSSQD